MGYKFLWFLAILLKSSYLLADSNSEDYALLAQRRMHYDINISDIQATFIKDRYNDIIGVILDVQERVLQEIYKTDEHLTLMQAIHPNYRTCIQRYKPRMYTKEQAQEKFNACLTASVAKFEKLKQDIDTPLNYAKNTANVKLPMAIETCQEYSSNGTLQVECVIGKVDEHSETFDENLNSVQDKMELNHSLSSLVTRDVMQCSFDIERHVLVKIGGSLQMIDVCLADYDLPPINDILLYN